MPLVSSFRAHATAINAIEIADKTRTIITCASDGSVRTFTMDGQHIGIFGQSTNWEMGQPASYALDQPRDVINADDPDISDSDDFESRDGLEGALGASAFSLLSLDDMLASTEHLTSGKSLQVSFNQLSRRHSHHSRSKGSSQAKLVRIDSPVKNRFVVDVPDFPRLNTSDLMSHEYDSWFAKSQYARQNFAFKPRRLPALTKSIGIGQRIYNRLQKHDLDEVLKSDLKAILNMHQEASLTE